jgi:hypothetical protein
MKVERAVLAAAVLGTALPALADPMNYGCLQNSYGYSICVNSRVQDNSNGGTIGTVQALDNTYYTASIAYADSYGGRYTYSTQIDNLTPVSSYPQPYPPQPVPPGPGPGPDNRMWVCSTQSNGRHFSAPGRGYEPTREKVVNICVQNGYTNPNECNYNATCQ